MEVTAHPKPDRIVPEQLLRHCLAPRGRRRREPARARLEATLGPELARRLLTGLTRNGRR